MNLELPKSILIYTGNNDAATLKAYFDGEFRNFLANVCPHIKARHGYRLQITSGEIYLCYHDDIHAYEELRMAGEYKQVPQEWWMLSVDDFIDKFESEIRNPKWTYELNVDSLL